MNSLTLINIIMLCCSALCNAYNVPAKTCFLPDTGNSKAPWLLTIDLEVNANKDYNKTCIGEFLAPDPPVCLKSNNVDLFFQKSDGSLIQDDMGEVFKTFAAAQTISGPRYIHIDLEGSRTKQPCLANPTRFCIRSTNTTRLTLNFSQYFPERRGCINMPIVKYCFSDKPLEFRELVEKIWNISPIVTLKATPHDY
jgi:hypothetical protein